MSIIDNPDELKSGRIFINKIVLEIRFTSVPLLCCPNARPGHYVTVCTEAGLSNYMCSYLSLSHDVGTQHPACINCLLLDTYQIRYIDR